MYLWEQVKKIPIDVRMVTPFQLGNVCEDPERCDALEEKGGDARESICPQCPVYTQCQQRGFLAQPSSLQLAKTQILALPQLFFDPQHAEMAEEILRQMDETERLCVIDRIHAYELFPECKLSKKILEEWSVNWQGGALGNFAKALLHAVEIKDKPHADAVKRIRAVMRAFEWQQDSLIQQMCLVNVRGKIITREFIDPDTGKQLARFTVEFEGGASAYIPLDNNAAEKLTAKGLPISSLPSLALNENLKIYMPMSKAIELGIFAIKNVKDIQKLPIICPNPDWTFWHQLESFFAHYTRDADAPIRWTGKVLKFWVPPVLHPNVKRLLLMSANLSDQHLRRAFPDKKIEVRRTELTDWVAGNKVFQIRTGIYPRKAILDYNSNWDLIGMSKTGQRFLLGIRAEIEKDPNIKHAIITYKSVASRLVDLAKMKNVCFVADFKKMEGLSDAFEEAHVVWIIGTPTQKQKTHLAASTGFIWKRQRTPHL